jgi:hypothetical protein
MLVRFLKHSALATIIAGAISAPAFAGGSAGAGVFTQSGNGSSSTGGAVLLSTSNALPVLPASIGLTGFAPLAKGGGYAVTLDGSFAIGKDAIGVGYGLGQFGAAHSGGTATVFFDHRVAPFTAIELRGYRTNGANGATAAFAGLKFSL